ncbi:DUF456 domain-containing protein [Halarchaeum sp. CBA1220]|uniref:DUF456 domain-containing protein n=1 Tax=Halarchaeum sp. CBA1220 TaxID=1853682 RepID=UPI000F3A9605|nr:DUF456 domain-containing protein [Halarchaeum sp. CBA1220]
MMDAVVLLAFGLLALGMVGSVLPLLPSGLVSLAGVAVYWWQTGDPGALVLAALVALCVVATAVDWFGGALAGYAGGASTRTTVLAGVVGLLLLPLGGPIGIAIGVVGTIVVCEYRRHGDGEKSVRAALTASIGILASVLVQLLCTGVVFGALLLVHYV